MLGCRTPEYMSPELLRNQSKDKTLKEYDPRSVDVWASGVLLLVSLCGAFPWDHTRQHDNFNDDQELDLWCSPSHHSCSQLACPSLNTISKMLSSSFCRSAVKRMTVSVPAVGHVLKL